MKLGEVCIHGSLRRSCETCEIADERDAQAKEIERLKATDGEKFTERDRTIAEISKENKQLEEKLTFLSGQTNFCAQCEAYAKEIERLKEEVRQRSTVYQDRDRWRDLCGKMAVEIKKNLKPCPTCDLDQSGQDCICLDTNAALSLLNAAQEKK